jgi:RHS repeat-associated protein
MDGNGETIGFNCNDTQYYYLKNVQGDVVGITDETGEIIAEYRYDSWGKLVSITDPSQNNLDVTNDTAHIGYANPVRYRGYYYDVETGLYYLNARYYDPETGRFISADDNLSDLNLFRYCYNNPVIFYDPNGKIVYLAHGTFSDPETWQDENEVKRDEFKNYVEGLFGEEVVMFGWSGENNDAARQTAATGLYNEIVKWHNENGDKDEPVRLVGHSHGGNVAILAANLLAENNQDIKIKNLITIATPVREYQLRASVEQHIQVYNRTDLVQFFGGSDGFRPRTAGRIFENATNIRVPGTWNPIGSHSSMHRNIDTWKKHIELSIKI